MDAKKAFSDLNQGDKIVIEKKIPQKELENLSNLISRFVEKSEKKLCFESVLENKFAHRNMVSSFVSAVIGTKFPGPGFVSIAAQTKMSEKFLIYDDTLKIEIIVEKKNYEKKSFQLTALCYNSKNELIYDGKSIVILL